MRDSEEANVAVELEITGWTGARPAEKRAASEVSLDDKINVLFTLHVGTDRISKENNILSVEEILDLVSHIDKLARRIEDDFEWSTVEKSVEMLKVVREGEALHTTLSLKLYGTPEGYRGNAGIGAQFDTSGANLSMFGKQIKAELGSLFITPEEALQVLSEKMEEKVKLLKKRGRITILQR